MTDVFRPERFVTLNPASRENLRAPPSLKPVQDLISQTFAIPRSSTNPSFRLTGTAATRNVSRPVAIVTRSIRSAAAWAVSSDVAHTTKVRPDVVSIRKKRPAPFGTPNRSSILTGSGSIPDPEASSSVPVGSPPASSPTPGDGASFATGVLWGLFHLRLRLCIAFTPHASFPMRSHSTRCLSGKAVTPLIVAR